jgi:hypothetical protein
MSTALLCFQYYDPLIGFYPIEKGEKIFGLRTKLRLRLGLRLRKKIIYIHHLNMGMVPLLKEERVGSSERRAKGIARAIMFKYKVECFRFSWH